MVGEGDQAVVEQRVAYLHARGLGHRADLAQVVVGQREFQVQVHHAVDVVVGGGAFVDLDQGGVGCRRIDGLDEIPFEYPVQRCAVQEVVAFQTQRQADPGLLDVASQLGQRKPLRQTGKTGDRLDHAMTEQGRQAIVVFEQALLRVAGVAAEDLVAAVACQHALEASLARRPGAEIGRHRGVVAERFVILACDDRHGGHDVCRLQVILVCAAGIALGGAARVFHFIEAVGVETDRKRVDWPAACGSQRPNHGRTVGAAGKEGGGRRPVRVPCGLVEQRAESGPVRPEIGIHGRVVGVPVKTGFEVAVAQQRDLSGEQLLHAPIEAARCGNGVEIQIVVYGLRIDGTAHGRVAGDLLGAAAENQMVAAMGVAQAFDAGTVERETGAFLQRLQHDESEIAPHQPGQPFGVAQPAVCHGHDRATFPGDQGKLVVVEAGAAHQGGGQAVLDMDVRLAETRAGGDAQELAAVGMQQRVGGLPARVRHVFDQFLVCAVVAQPAENAIHGVSYRSVAG